MRWIVASLLAINIAIAGWYVWQGPGPEAEQVGDGLPELTHNNLQTDAQPTLADAPSLTSLQNETSEDEQCAFVGDFTSASVAEEAQSRLQSLEISTSIEVVEIPDEPLWWVHIPPASSSGEAQRALTALNEREIESFLVSQGEFANAISLGYFRSRDNAMALDERLNDEGIGTQVREIQRFNDSYWLVASPDTAGMLSESSLQGIRDSAPDVELRRADCDWLQNS